MSRSRANATVFGAVIAAVVTAVVLVLVVASIALRPHATGGHDNEIPLLLAAQVAPVEAAPAVDVPSATPDSARSRLGISEAWVTRIAARTHLPAPAVRAYGAASLNLARTQPSCHLGWTTLAGIGTVESGNGTGGHRTLSDSGFSSSPIMGPALNGAGYAAVPLDGGDWDHAWGPMQFITSTWNQWAADGDGDGTADVNNIYDAALAAGHYLCADGRNLSTARGWSAAVFSYNHSAVYVQQVYDAANAAAR